MDEKLQDIIFNLREWKDDRAGINWIIAEEYLTHSTVIINRHDYKPLPFYYQGYQIYIKKED